MVAAAWQLLQGTAAAGELLGDTAKLLVGAATWQLFPCAAAWQVLDCAAAGQANS